MTITVIDRNGPPHAMVCPSILCDACLAPIDNLSALATWTSTWDESGRPSVALHFVHKGVCDLQTGDEASEELGAFLTRLLHNSQHPFVLERNVEYVAPKPSRWRLGSYASCRTDTTPCETDTGAPPVTTAPARVRPRRRAHGGVRAVRTWPVVIMNMTPSAQSSHSKAKTS